MTTQYYVGPRYGHGSRFVGFVLALLLGALVCVGFVRYATRGVLGRMATLITGRATTFDTSVPAVVEKIHRLNRLETVEYSIDTVVEGDRSTPLLPDALAGDRLLLVVHGQSIAGIDLSVPVDQNLETETRAKAQDQLQQAALADGILDAARKNARATVTTLLYSLGFQKVDVT